MGYQEPVADWLAVHSHQIVDSIAESIVSTDARTHIIFFNSGAEEMFGYKRNEVLGKPLDILVPERFRGDHFRYLTKFTAQEEPARMLEGRGRVTALRSDYTEFPAEISIARFPVSGSTVFSAVVREVSAQAEAERRLAESEQRYRRLTDNLPGMVYERVLYPDGKIAYPFVSSGIRALLGLEPEAVMANPSLLLERMHEEDRERYEAALNRSARTQEPLDIEFRHRHTNGAIRRIHTVSRPWIRDSDGAIVWEAMGFDTTSAWETAEENRKLEIKIRQAEKMEAVATLASGVAHEINNLLHPICATSEKMLSKSGPENPFARELKRIQAAAWQASKIVEKILVCGRAAKSGTEQVDLVSAVNQAADFVRPTLAASLSLRVTHDGTPLVMPGCGAQLIEAAMNLFVNARDATGEGGGTIAVGLSKKDLCAPFPQTCIGDLKPGPYAVLTVEDNGAGMDEATKQRIFDPFFTTKPPGKGTGLGLSVASETVRTHGGAIGVESNPGAGAKFSVYLPLA